ncbi:hypothetical protein MBLL_00773 (plasmid) [Methylobacterium bullatum]|uniref:Uncharacterized protein n=1 Tax=Methylobacterium bullatum TaxID=570505 RepID=A0A679JMB8_9HYPH|nr:hypothetical protein MBLL_00773 [Methylobacterium bullatum]
MTLPLTVRRFYCRHRACRRGTFVESLPRLLPSRAGRTDRLAQAQARVSLALGGEAGARLAGHLAMATSPDTMLRLVHGMKLPPAGPLRAVGIDGWAIREGQTYGTLLVDLDRRRPIDLLPDRASTTVAAWLRRHPGITVITRDRSSRIRASRHPGRSCGSPGRRPVASPPQSAPSSERWLARVHGRLRCLPSLAIGDGRRPGQRLRAYRRSEAEIAVSRDSRARRLRPTRTCVGAPKLARPCWRLLGRQASHAERCASTLRPRAFRNARHVAPNQSP